MFGRRRPPGSNGRESEAALARVLRHLDPGIDDPGYWLRFRRSVLAAAGPELERRRRIADVTVGELVVSWSRAFVPAALAAAAIAAFLTLTSVPQTAPGADVEDLLTEGVSVPVEEPIPAALFASEAF